MIIGIIVTLAVPQYELFVIRMKGAEPKQNLSAIADSLWRYYLESGKFPPRENIPDSPYNPPPFCLDIQVSGKSKYFMYQYFNNEGVNPLTRAYLGDYISPNWLEGVPIGAVVAYDIQINKNPADYLGYQGKAIGNGWYRYYYHWVKSAPNGVRGETGWP